MILGKYSSKEWCNKLNERHYLKPFLSTYHKLVRGAKRKSIKCDLTYEQFLAFTKIKNCFYCNRDILWIPNGKTHRYNLDRKDNKIGYLEDNLVVCCWECNNLKGNKVNFEDFCILGNFILKDKDMPYWLCNYLPNQFMNLNGLDY
jgi:5-methylcytosine-specific restriction endonuclease McrA